MLCLVYELEWSLSLTLSNWTYTILEVKSSKFVVCGKEVTHNRFIKNQSINNLKRLYVIGKCFASSHFFFDLARGAYIQKNPLSPARKQSKNQKTLRKLKKMMEDQEV